MGLGKTVTLIALHLHRVAEGAAAGRPVGPTLVVCPASLLGNWEAEIHRFAPGVPVRRFHGGRRSLEGLAGGFVLTTYGTMRRSASRPLGRAVTGVGPRRRRRGAARQERPLLDGAGAAGDPERRPGRADRHPGRERPHRALGDPRLGDARPARQPHRLPQGVGRRPSSPGLEPTKARQFADLIGPFLLRRRKSDPGIAPELPAKTETDHQLSG